MPTHCPLCSKEGKPAIPAKPCKHMVEAHIDNMQDALDALVELATENKAIWLADAIDHLSIAIQYAKMGTK